VLCVRVPALGPAVGAGVKRSSILCDGCWEVCSFRVLEIGIIFVASGVAGVSTGVVGVSDFLGRFRARCCSEGVAVWTTDGARETVGVSLTASASKIPDSLSTLRPAARSFVSLSCTAFAVGFSLKESAIGWYSMPEMSRPKPNRSSERSFSAVHFILRDFGRKPSGAKEPPPGRWSSMGFGAAELVPLDALAWSRTGLSDWKVDILDCVATDVLRRAAGILLVPASTASLAVRGVPRGCGQMKEDLACVVPTGIARGVGTVACLGKEVALERSARSFSSMYSNAAFMNGLGLRWASCSLPLSWFWLLSDILFCLSRGVRKGKERKGKGSKSGLVDVLVEEEERKVEYAARCVSVAL